MAKDGRSSRSVVSGCVIIESGGDDGGSVLSLRDDETLAPDYVKLHYSNNATTEVQVTLFDEADFEAVGEHTDDWDTFVLSPGDEIVIEDATYKDVYDGVVVETDGNNDDDLVVTVGGVEVTG